MGQHVTSDLHPHYIEFRHVYKTFDTPVLVDTNFGVNAGETVAIIGRSGVGKSVTLSHIMGFLKPDAAESSWPTKISPIWTNPSCGAFAGR